MVDEQTRQRQAEALGAYIRAQRELASLSLRQLSQTAGVSNAYLSQIERGLNEPSIRVVTSIAQALGLEPEVLLREAGLVTAETDGSAPPISTEQAIRTDEKLSDAEKDALIVVYRSYVANKT